MSAHRTAIACWGSKTLHLHAGGHNFEWSFLLAAVAFPIIGADFLAAFDLKIDLKRLQLEHGAQQWTLRLATPPPGSTFAAIVLRPVVEGLEQAWIPTQCAHARSNPRQVSHRLQKGEFPTKCGPLTFTQPLPVRPTLERQGSTSNLAYLVTSRLSRLAHLQWPRRKGLITPLTLQGHMSMWPLLPLPTLPHSPLQSLLSCAAAPPWKRPPAVKAGVHPPPPEVAHQTTKRC